MPTNTARSFLVCVAAWVLGAGSPVAVAAEAKKAGKKPPAPSEQAVAPASPSSTPAPVEPPGVQSPLEQIRILRQQMDKQGQEIGELRSALEELRSVARVREQPSTPLTETPVTAAPAPATAATGTPTADPTRIERAEAVPTGPQHTVAKGETLTSIAKHYNITIVDLQKANKVVDDRKLQIGQVLNLPATKSVDTPTEKKETP